MPSSIVDDYPSLLWIIFPPLLLLAGYFTRKWYLARRLRLHGIGKGAPGFQTSVRQIRVTPEIAARLRRGEHVSPEEIAQASARAENGEEQDPAVVKINEEKKRKEAAHSEPGNEWLPETVTGPKRRGKGKRK